MVGIRSTNGFAWRWWAGGAALGLFAALLLTPATGWIVRGHLRAGSGRVPAPPLLAELGIREIPLFGAIESGRRPIAWPSAAEVAARYPGQYAPALAQSLSGPGPQWQAETRSTSTDLTPGEARVRPLVARFGSNPGVYADLVRMACLGGLLSHRPENYLVSGDQPPKSPAGAREWRPTARQLDSFCDAASAGERLEPDNAYFPFLRAAGLLAAGKDQAGMDALQRAGACTRWDEHITPEVTGRWQLAADLFGDRSSLTRSAMAAGVLLPHYSTCRSLARVATYKAMVAERSGRLAEGQAIRHALLQAAGLMRSDATSGIGALVGAALAEIAICKDSGATGSAGGILVGSDLSAARRRRVDDYTAGLRARGQAGEAGWVEREFRTHDEAGRIIRTGVSSGDWLASLVHAGAWNTVGAATFALLVWLLLLGSLAGRSLRRAGLEAGLPVPTKRWWRVALAIVLVAAAPLTLFYLLARDGLVIVAGMSSVIANFTGKPAADAAELRQYTLTLVVAMAPLLVVPLATVVMAVRALARRQPLTAALARGWASAALPMLGLAMLLYVVVVVQQARAEANECSRLGQRVAHEGRYYAALLHTTWPR